MDINDILDRELTRIMNTQAWISLTEDEQAEAIEEAKDEASRDYDMTPWPYLLAEIVEG